ncbi:MAG: hypothetical protein KKC20_00555, partial [Proteobacteria bacterium]|nr:hypothetical protein [Pseudomonadota bacterium]
MLKINKRLINHITAVISFTIIAVMSLTTVTGEFSVLHAQDAEKKSPHERMGLLRLPSNVASSMPVMETAFIGSTLPSAIDLSPYMPPVADQGNQGSCAAFSLGYGLKSFMEGKEDGSFDKMQGTVQKNPYVMSPKYLYHTGKYHDSQKKGNAAWGESGMFMEEALEYLKDIG